MTNRVRTITLYLADDIDDDQARSFARLLSSERIARHVHFGEALLDKEALALAREDVKRAMCKAVIQAVDKVMEEDDRLEEELLQVRDEFGGVAVEVDLNDPLNG